MSTALTLIGDGDYARKFSEQRDAIASDESTARSNISEKLSALIALQHEEIRRLQAIIDDATTFPDRHPVEIAIGSVAGERGQLKHVLLAVASDRSTWIMENFSPNAAPGLIRWHRVPALPQVSDEAEGGR